MSAREWRALAGVTFLACMLAAGILAGLARTGWFIGGPL